MTVSVPVVMEGVKQHTIGTAVPVALINDGHSAMDDQRRNPGKVFVGGLGQCTTDYSLKAYFSQFGTVQEGAVVADKITNRSRGFGFCTFTSQEAAERCLAASHKIDGVSCEVRRAVPRDEARATAPYDTVIQPSKLFIGGLSEDVTEDRMFEYFEHYGKLQQATLMYDKNSHRPRGFGFVVFEDPTRVDKAIGSHTALGRSCEAKKAEPRPDLRRNRRGGMTARDSFRPNGYDDPRMQERMPLPRYADPYHYGAPPPNDRYTVDRYGEHERYDVVPGWGHPRYGGPPYVSNGPTVAPPAVATPRFNPSAGQEQFASHYDPYSSYYDPYAYAQQPQCTYAQPSAQPVQVQRPKTQLPASHVYCPPPDNQQPTNAAMAYYGNPQSTNAQMYAVESNPAGSSYGMAVPSVGYQTMQHATRGAPPSTASPVRPTAPVARGGFLPHRQTPRYGGAMVRTSPY